MLAKEQQKSTTTMAKTTTTETKHQPSKQPKAKVTSKLKGNIPKKVIQGQNSIQRYLELKSMETCVKEQIKFGTEIHRQTKIVLSSTSSDFTDSTNGKTTQAKNSTDTVSSTAEREGNQSNFCKDGQDWSE